MSATNHERPFEPGERINFCGEHYEVLENHGGSGVVRELPDGAVIGTFYWRFEGVDCTRVED